MRRWSATYDLVVRLLPDVALQADGVRSTNDAFRDEIEAILDRVLPDLVPPERMVTLRASEVTSRFDWFARPRTPRRDRRSDGGPAGPLALTPRA